jgi:hypothetical protein
VKTASVLSLGLLALLFAVSPPTFAEVQPEIIARIEVDMPLRAPSICRGPEGTYYLTGTVSTRTKEDGTPNWYENDGVYLWKSTDLESWKAVGCVMALKDQPYELYGPYRWLHKVQVAPDRYGEQRLYGVVAPEVHYARGTFWLTISMTRQGTALMKSSTGEAEGPYELVDLLTTRGGDPSVFADGEDLWWVFDAGYLAKLVESKPGKHTPPGREITLALEPRPDLMRPEPDESGFPLRVGERGAFMVKDEGKCHLIATQRTLREDGTAAWDTFVASADAPDGSYGPRRLLIPGGGQATLFRGEEGEWLAACALDRRVGDAEDELAIVKVHLQ